MPHGLGQAIRTWRTELDSFYEHLNNTTIFHKHLKVAIDSKLIKKHRSSIFENREKIYLPNGKKNKLLKKVRKARKKFKLRRKKNSAALVGPRRLKLKLAISSALKKEEKRKKADSFYSEDLNKEYIYESHDLIHNRYFTWRLNWLRRLWTSDYNLYSKKNIKVRQKLKKKKHTRRKLKLISPLFHNEIKKIKKSTMESTRGYSLPGKILNEQNKKNRVLNLFQNRLEKSSFIIGKYIKIHNSINEQFENIRLKTLHPYYMSWKVLNIYVINIFKKH